jgi:hypothetical protein
MRLKLKVDKSGKVHAVYSDAHAGLIDKAAHVEITRASAVEPDPRGGWTATMKDGTKLGPYRLRSEALEAEVQYLDSVLFPEEAKCTTEVHAPAWSGLTCDHPKSLHDPTTGKCSGYLEFNWGDYPCECEHFTTV